MHKQAGFTIVELIVVILILGILAATALPKFLDVTQDAHIAAVKGTGGGLGAGVTLAHAQWVANGATPNQDGVTNFGNSDVDVNTPGWPVSTDGGGGPPPAANTVNDADDCVDLWNGVMQNPPVVEGTVAMTNDDYTATVVAGPECLYTYNAVGTMNIQYNPATGAVVTTTP